MARNKYVGLRRLNHPDGLGRIVARIAAYVGHQHPFTLALEKIELIIGPAHNPAVDITIYALQGLESGNLVGQLQRTEIARVPNLIDIFQELAQRLIKCIMGIGYYTYAFHLLLIILIAPLLLYPLGNLLLGAVLHIRSIKRRTHQRLGHKLLLNKTTLVVVGIFVVFAISSLAH